MSINKGYLTVKTNKESDEYYTPREAVIPLLDYLNKDKYKTIWCPFDTKDSEYVKIFKENNFNVIATHIDNKQNFFIMNQIFPMILLFQIRHSLVKMMY